MIPLVWTTHSRFKMREHGLSESRVKRVINSPERVEEGIAEGTVAVMKSAGTIKHPYEIWVMVSKESASKKIVSAWKYPGKTKPGEPLPREIVWELRAALTY
ncbi:MAG: DUF4258 domain-containing protein [Candidatus Colwellbacteria bacterium]|nr:DUF4258 domain-containing protein [Candidatus Colwellbacteria bacterium]